MFFSAPLGALCQVEPSAAVPPVETGVLATRHAPSAQKVCVIILGPIVSWFWIWSPAMS